MKYLCCALALLLPLVAHATEEVPVDERGATTERWLQVQREGQQASPEPQEATPAERELAYKRWLESFNHPIPDFFGSQGGEIGGR